MQNTQTISTNKLVAFLVFICAALFSSLFIFHLSNKPKIMLSPDYGTLFPSAREIKPFKLITSDNQPFTQKNLYGHWTLLFFGFTHCSSICPTTLALLNRSYNKLHDQYANLQVAFISLDPSRDTPDALQKYTQSFNPNFIGASGEIQELHKLQSQLGIFATRDTATPESDYQLQHTASILLIDPKGRWAGMFKFGLNPEQLAQAFTESMKSLS